MIPWQVAWLRGKSLNDKWTVKYRSDTIKYTKYPFFSTHTSSHNMSILCSFKMGQIMIEIRKNPHHLLGSQLCQTPWVLHPQLQESSWAGNKEASLLSAEKGEALWGENKKGLLPRLPPPKAPSPPFLVLFIVSSPSHKNVVFKLSIAVCMFVEFS